MSSHEVSLAVWQAYQDSHGVGTVVDATVVSVVPFGAFVEVAPGIHGLLHKDSWVRTPQAGDSISVRIAEWGPPRLSVALAQ
ncbi:S1 RNA-binding domain-containing protein [Nocardia sp. NPDC050793]|uniref:S1 RNA-binding domain-containing protein n=1 Tax=Nocardia sp. NPDC050793 TaxID=3155159 RepID=UPI0034061E35